MRTLLACLVLAGCIGQPDPPERQAKSPLAETETLWLDGAKWIVVNRRAPTTPEEFRTCCETERRGFELVRVVHYDIVTIRPVSGDGKPKQILMRRWDASFLGFSFRAGIVAWVAGLGQTSIFIPGEYAQEGAHTERMQL